MSQPHLRQLSFQPADERQGSDSPVITPGTLLPQQVKPATLVETGVGSAGECGLTEGTVEAGATSEVAGHAARIGVQLKVLQEERVFLASGILGCEEPLLGSSL